MRSLLLPFGRLQKLLHSSLAVVMTTANSIISKDSPQSQLLDTMYVCMYVCMYVWMYVCIHVCMYVQLHPCMHICMYVYMYARCVHTYVRVHNVYVQTYACTQECMTISSCTYACTLYNKYLCLPRGY